MSNFLTIEQSQELLTIGVKPFTLMVYAIMSTCEDNDSDDRPYGYYWTNFWENKFGNPHSYLSHRNLNKEVKGGFKCTPIFSVGDLIKLLPNSVTFNCKEYFRNIRGEAVSYVHYFVNSYDFDSEKILFNINNGDLVNNLFNAVIKIKKEYNE